MAITRATILPFLLYTLFNFITMLLDVPTVRLFEHAACVRHFQRKADEAECKAPDTQNTLSQVVGWKLTLDACAGLATAMFYGSVAERVGEKLVLCLATVGYLAMQLLDMLICSFPYTFPIQTVWLSSVLLLVGGGQRVFNSMIFTLIANALDETRRTTFFYWLAFGPHCMRFIAPVAASRLMGIGLLAPFWLGITLLVIQAGLVFLVVNSDQNPSTPPSNEGYFAVAHSENEAIDNPERSDLQMASRTSHEGQDIMSETGQQESSDICLHDRIIDFLRTTSRDIIALLKVRNTLFCLGTVFLKKIGFSSGNFASQYVSERFGWHLKDTTWLRAASGAGAISIGVTAPVLTAQLIRRGYYPPAIDLGSIRSALTILSTSFFATWLAPSASLIMIAMFGVGLGEGLEPALQGFFTFSAESIKSVNIFTTYAFVDAAAELTAGPFMARLLAIGRTDSHPSNGVCFLVSSCIFLLLLASSCFITIRQSERK